MSDKVDFKVYHIADGVELFEGQKYIYQERKMVQRDYMTVLDWNIDEEDDTVVNIKVQEIVSPDTVIRYPESVEPKWFRYERIQKGGKDLVEMLTKGSD